MEINLKLIEINLELAKKAEIKKFTNFLEIYNKELYNLEDAFSETPFIHWDFDSNRIDLDVKLIKILMVIIIKF